MTYRMKGVRGMQVKIVVYAEVAEMDDGREKDVWEVLEGNLVNFDILTVDVEEVETTEEHGERLT